MVITRTAKRLLQRALASVGDEIVRTPASHTWPTDSDEDVELRGVRAAEWLARSDRATSLTATRLVTEDIVWAYSPLDATRAAVLSAGYPRINYSTRVAVKWFSDASGARGDHTDHR